MELLLKIEKQVVEKKTPSQRGNLGGQTILPFEGSQDP